LKGNNFKTSLKVNVPQISRTDFKNYTNTNINLLLMKLGLFPAPKNVQANISEDGNYLNLSLKQNSDEKPLQFQFALEEPDFSELHNRSDYQDLIQRYYLYVNDYVDEINKYAMLERKYIQEKFPSLIFNIKIRIKSFDSYMSKLAENMSKEKDLYINDIIAERIILSGYNNSQDEQLLTQMCDEVAKALYDFRIDTNFRMKKEVSHNEANSEKQYVTKDYIAHPKKNGYQSLHILMENKNNKDFTYETQIRTFEMEKISKTSGEIAHNKYKPRLLNDLSPNRVPIYSEVLTDKSGNPIITPISLENRFYHFYNSDKDMSIKNRKHSTSITYSKFREQQYELENLLGIQFKDLRAKLRDLNLKNKIKNQEAR